MSSNANQMAIPRFYLSIGVIVLLCTLLLPEPVLSKIAYQFVRYHYKKKPKIERLFKQEWRLCERTDGCAPLFSVDRTRCVRICMAPQCHEEIYGHDELEEGEIDVRGTSFKGCWRQRYHEFNRVDL